MKYAFRVRTLETAVGVVDVLGCLPPPNHGMPPHDRRLFTALGEVGLTCRAAGFLLFSSIVVAKESGVPGTWYYADHHPQARSGEGKFMSWRSEFNMARNTTFQPGLGSP